MLGSKREQVLFLRLFPGGVPIAYWILNQVKPLRYFSGPHDVIPEGVPLCDAVDPTLAHGLLVPEDLQMLPDDATVYEASVCDDHFPDRPITTPPGVYALRASCHKAINCIIQEFRNDSGLFAQTDRYFDWRRVDPRMDRLDLAAENGWIGAWCIEGSRILNATGDGVVAEDTILFDDLFDVAFQRFMDLGHAMNYNRAAWFGNFLEPKPVASLVESWFPESFYLHRDCSPKNAGTTASLYFFLNGYTEIAPAGHPRAHYIGAFKLRPDAPFP